MMTILGISKRCSSCGAHRSPNVNCPWLAFSSSGINCQSSMNGTLTAVRLISPKRKKTGSEPSKKK